MKHKLALLICWLISILILVWVLLGTNAVQAGVSLPDARRLPLSSSPLLPPSSSSSSSLWGAWRPATCMPDRCFCERIRAGVIRQPSNTWSNLGFLLTGLTIVATGARDRWRKTSSGARNPMRARFVYPGVLGAATVLIGIGSMFYHSSMTFAGQSVDVISMYLLTSFMAVYNLSRARQTSSRAFVVFCLLLNVALGTIAVHWPVSRRYIFVGLILAVLASEILCRRRLRPVVRTRESFFYGAIASLALACTCWVVDITGVICWPDSWLQAHAAWHLLTAASAGFVYLYYRSETGSCCLPTAYSVIQ